MPIRYEITNGALPVTVYLMQGITVIDSNVHNAYEQGQFDVYYDNYSLYFEDAMDCNGTAWLYSTTTTTTLHPPTTTTTTTPPPTTTTTSTSSTTTTSTTSEPTTTTTSTTIIYCESPLCETALTVGTDGDGNYGFLRGLVGSISPDCGSVNVVGYMDSQGLLGVVLIDYVCDVTLWINGVEYELTYFGYVSAYGGNAYFISLVPNPLPSVGETCNVAICGTECTTTTEEPTTTTTTTTSECECNSSMTVGSYIQGEYVSVGYGRDGMPPMDFSVMGSISPDCWNVVALCHNTYYTSKSILLILRNYPCCESIIVEINGVEYTLVFSLQNDIYCSYILSGVDNPFPEEGQICNIAICETSCTTTTTTEEPTTTTTTTSP